MSFGSLPSVLGNGGGVAISVIGGTGLFADGTAAAPSISFAAEPSTGWYRASAGTMALSLSGTQRLNLFYSSTVVKLRNTANNNEIGLVDAGAVQITAAGTNQNITLTPSGTGYVSVSKPTDYAANTDGSFGIYGTTNANKSLLFGLSETGNGYGWINAVTKGSAVIPLRLNPQGGQIWIGAATTDSGALLQIGTNTTNAAGGMVFGTDTFLYRTTAGYLALQAGTGTAGSLQLFQSATLRGQLAFSGNDTYLDASTGSLFIRTNGTTTALTLDSSQNATFAASVTAASSVNAGTNAGFVFTSKCVITSPSDGILKLSNNAQTDFTRLQFGGTTSSFPALRRNGTALDVVLADNTGFTAFQAANFTAKSAASAVAASEICYGGTTATTVGAAGGASALPATPTGYIIVNVAGTQMKVPYYAN